MRRSFFARALGGLLLLCSTAVAAAPGPSSKPVALDVPNVPPPPSKMVVAQHFGKVLGTLKTATPTSSRSTSTSGVTTHQLVACATAGSLDITATQTTTANGFVLQQKIVAKNCVKANAYQMDGTLAMSTSEAKTGSTETVTQVVNGSIAIVIFASDGTVQQSGDMTFNNATQVVTIVSGGTPTASYSGTITEGGTTFAYSGFSIPGA